MTCQHLIAIETALIDAGITEKYRGQPWSTNCREWVYFDCRLDVDALMDTNDLGPTIEAFHNNDPRSGLESGIRCSQCHDALVGIHPKAPGDYPTFP